MTYTPAPPTNRTTAIAEVVARLRGGVSAPEQEPVITTPEMAVAASSAAAGLTVGSVCAGIGGFDLGLERAGHKILWQIEIDEFRQSVLRKHFPGSAIYSDLRANNNLPYVDILCGGIPCQPHSVIGKRKGADDDRDLWPDYARIIRQIRPQYIILENVTGLLSSNGGAYFGRILGELAEIGYDAEWDCLSSGEAGGASGRERVFLLAYPAQVDRHGGQILRQARAAIEICRQAQGKNEIEWWGGRTYRASPNGRMRAYPLADVLGVANAVPSQLDINRMMAIGDTVDPVVTEAIGRAILADAEAQKTAEPIEAALAITEEAQSPEPTGLEVWPALARLAIASGDAAAFRLYVFLWNLCKATGGHVAAASVVNGDVGREFGGTLATRRRLINRGEGRYWNSSGGRLWLVGAQKLALSLETLAESCGIAGYDELEKRKMYLPAESIGSLKTFQAACLNAWISERKGKSYMVTWRVLAAQWGNTRQTLRAWMKLAGVKSIENYGRRWLGNHKKGAPHVYDVVIDDKSGNPQIIVDQDGQVWAYFQRGNTYVGNASYSSKGARKAINAHSGNYTGDRPCEALQGAVAERWHTDRPRANFVDIDAFQRHKKRGREIAENSYIRNPKRSNADRTLWTLDH